MNLFSRELLLRAPLVPKRGEIGDDLGMIVGKIDCLGPVFRQVVERPRPLPALADDLVVALHDGVGVVVVEDVGVVAVDGASLEDGDE